MTGGAGRHRKRSCLAGAALLGLALAGCATTPLAPYSTATPALVLTPIAQAGIADGRGRFREIFCAVLGARSRDATAALSCDQALVRLDDEPSGTGAPVDLAASRGAFTVVYVLGLWSDCADQTVRARTEMNDYLARFGFHLEVLKVSGISGTKHNAQLIRDALEAEPELGTTRRAVIVAHSKGVVDTLEALVEFPELHSKVAAVVSLAGAVGGSLLAERAPDAMLKIAASTPGLKCRDGDMGALQSLRPTVRRTWLAHNRLPDAVRYYSIVALPEPARVSSGLKISYKRLSEIDARNDGNLLYYDQVVPQSTLLGYANADHWAIATDLGASPYAVIRQLADQSAFPRAEMLEAALRFIEEDLRAGASTP
jgi:hypothetical protein